jgi:D-alanyl-D-alanine carboxypeptidase
MKASNERTRRPAPRLIAQAGPSPRIASPPPAPQPALRPTPPAQPGSPAIEMARVRPVLVTGATGAAPSPPDGIEALLARAETSPSLAPAAAPPVSPPAAPSTAGGAFQIQVGAFQSQTEAQRQLAAIRERAGNLLDSHAAVTTPLQQGAKTIYRARYAGFAAHAAAAGVCSALKRLSISCLVMAAE